MSINSVHPLYQNILSDWDLVGDVYLGERHIKSKGKIYLPPTAGHYLDGYGKGSDKPGQIAYDSYVERAVFHDFFNVAVESYIGLLHQKPATFELPDGMQEMLKKASSDGESLQALLRRINVEQLVFGRVGLLLDFPVNVTDNAMPWIAVYNAKSCINWDSSDDREGVNSLNLVVLDESGYVRKNGFDWVHEEKYRVLLLDQTDEQTRGLYKQGVFVQTREDITSPDVMVQPSVRGTPLSQIPFVFVNSKDIISTPDKPPLLGLAKLAVAIYRGEADYRHTLFMQGQDTLVTIGGIVPTNGLGRELELGDDSDWIRTGANARIDLNMGGDAKYIGIGAEGLAEQRIALENDKSEARARSGQLISPSAGKQESGEALQTRLAAQTATLNQIAKSGALGLENLLKIAAEWMGFNPDEVKVTPNLEFVERAFVAQDLVQLMSARTQGAPLSLQSIHNLLVSRGVTSMNYEDELSAIEDEDMIGVKAKAKLNEMMGLNPDGSFAQNQSTLDNLSKK